eukprot:jgi/Chrzof1/2368/Cz11g12160.t1
MVQSLGKPCCQHSSNTAQPVRGPGHYILSYGAEEPEDINALLQQDDDIMEESEAHLLDVPQVTSNRQGAHGADSNRDEDATADTDKASTPPHSAVAADACDESMPVSDADCPQPKAHMHACKQQP